MSDGRRVCVDCGSGDPRDVKYEPRFSMYLCLKHFVVRYIANRERI